MNQNNKTLSHVNERGEAHMVDVGPKEITHRRAIAKGSIRMDPDVLIQLQNNQLAKGDAIATARIAGIQAAKETSRLIPLCHPLPLTKIDVDISPRLEEGIIAVSATVEAHARTGVEMEALTAVSITCLTLYDMAKSADRSMVIEAVRVVEKTGGKSGPAYGDPLIPSVRQS